MEEPHHSKPATFVAFSAASLLFGVLSSQALVYFRHYPQDRLCLKIFGITRQVATILLLETAQLVLFAVMAWFIILGPGPSPQVFHLVSGAHFLIDGTIIGVVQGLSSYAFDVNSSNPDFLVAVDAITGVVDIVLVISVRGRSGASTDWVTQGKQSGQEADVDEEYAQVFLNVNAGVVNTLWAFVALGLLIAFPSSGIHALVYLTGTTTPPCSYH
ncbi:hypothetical protein GSI_13404 [Ganoderma sinense ZZ0214-1]|uniref:Uncharacterized protein n=1 Tax=Ganoderma sinense ZZ0214-1 TaxID=1077348 RepID=A0A2G8RSQ3_9APHY|nr:hypothetical protein GSI_13404 [Ganoderma sinense ZZ0214-1]